MRVLLLIDSLDSKEIHDEAEFLLYRLDQSRIQTIISSLQPGISGITYSMNARTLIDLAACRRLYRFIREQDIELIHVLDERSLYNAVIVGLVAERPVVASIHHIAAEETLLRRLTQRLMWRLLRHLIARVVVPSELMYRRFWRVTEFPKARMDIIYPSLPSTEMPDEAEIAFLGLPKSPLIGIPALTPDDDGYTVLFDALPRIRQRIPDVSVVVVGAPAVVTAWQRRYTNLRLNMPVRWVPDTRMLPAVIAASDVILSHSAQERWHDELILALLCGRAVVAARVGGVTELIESAITGLLVTPGDVRDLTLQTTRLLTQPTFAQRLGARAREHALEMFSAERRRDTLTVLYETTIYATR